MSPLKFIIKRLNELASDKGLRDAIAAKGKRTGRDTQRHPFKPSKDRRVDSSMIDPDASELHRSIQRYFKKTGSKKRLKDKGKERRIAKDERRMDPKHVDN